MREGQLRWIGAVVSRLVHLGLAWTLFLSCFCCCLPLPGDASSVWRRLRTTLFVATLVMLVVEGRRTRAAIRGLVEDRPRKGWALVRGVVALALIGGCAVGWATWFAAMSPHVHAIGSQDLYLGLVAIGVLAILWSVATLETLRLAWDGLVLLRLRLAAWREDQRPTALPLTVAAWSTVAFFVALGFPSPELVGGLAWFTLVALTILLPEPGRPVDLLVTVKPGRTIEDVEIVAESGGQASRAFPSAPADVVLFSTWVVTVPSQHSIRVILSAWLDDDVLWVEADPEVTPSPADALGACAPSLTRLPVDDPFAGSALDELGAAAALHQLAARRPVRPATVAIVDTGVASAHPDLRGVVVPWASGDRDGHGTACAGVAAAVADNGRGVASLNWQGEFLRVRSYPALAGPSPDADDVARAIVDAAEDSADVINLSFVGEGVAPRAVAGAVQFAQAEGSIVVAAAGNGGGDAREHWPANIEGVLVVGATEHGSPARFSKSVDRVEHGVWAPGAEVCALGADGGYARRTGTSMAAPMVSATIGLLRSYCPQLGGREAIGIVEASGAVMGGGGTALRVDRALALLFERHPECGGTTRGFGGGSLRGLLDDTGG